MKKLLEYLEEIINVKIEMSETKYYDKLNSEYLEDRLEKFENELNQIIDKRIEEKLNGAGI